MGRKKGRRRSPMALKIKKETLYSIVSIALFACALLIIISFAGQGALLKGINTWLADLFGMATLLIPFLFVSGGLMLTSLNWKVAKPTVFLGAILLFITNLGLWKAGSVGSELFENLAVLIQPLGAVVMFVGIGFAGFLILTESSLDDVLLALSAIGTNVKKAWAVLSSKKPSSKPTFETNESTIRIRGGGKELVDVEHAQKARVERKQPTPVKKKSNAGDETPEGLSTEVVANVPGGTGGVYVPPSLDLLYDYPSDEADRGDIKANASIIERTLESFGMKARVVEVNLGPAVTQYALEIALGTKLSRITALQNDLALALAAPTGQIRIEAPIPGRAMVGIEIPNRKPETVPLKTMLISKPMKTAKNKVTVGLGLDVSGDPVVANIAKMPHVLIAGATGSGKSVAVNAIILQMLFRASPEEVKFILVDPKRVELTQYNGIPHLLTPVIVDAEKVVAALEWATAEMEKRYKLFAEVGVRNIEGYNDLSGFQALPYIVIVIDELADVMLFAPSKVEDAITRLAQMARATGMHLILATQRPSVDVLTGLIKANIPTRIAFNVATAVDSRVIIDSVGAEKLLGSGDMLYIPPDQAKPSRVQGTYVSDEETAKILDHIRGLGVEVAYTEEVTTKFAPKKIVGEGGAVEDVDDLFDEAVEVVISHDKASASLLQRRLSIGYARAARIVDQLQAAGVVSAAQGSKPREVLIKSLDELSSTS